MTTPEHTLVGIHFAFALGCHRKFGWSTVALAGFASNIPDWDGIPMFFDMQRYEVGHRVWGHNFLAIMLSSLLLGWTQTRYHWVESVGKWIAGKFPLTNGEFSINHKANERTGLMTFLGISIAAQLLHLPCDMVVSGGNGLSDWAIQPFWPFSRTGYVYPMIPWGDIGATVILMSGIIYSAKRPKSLSATSSITLVVLCTYLLARAWSRSMLTT